VSHVVDGSAPRQLPLGDHLRALRETSGKPQREIADRLGWSLSKLQRTESGQRSVAGLDLDRLIEVYQLMPPAAAHLRRLASPGRDRVTSSEFADVLPFRIRRFIDYESSASRIQNYEPQLVPGLLQSPAYARAVLKQMDPERDDEVVERLVKARVIRQRVLSRFSPLVLEAIIDETVLTRAVGGRRVMAEQLGHLRREASRANVSLGVVPIDAGAYPGMRSPFIVMDFPRPDQEQLLFLEDPVKDVLVIGRGEPGGPQPASYSTLFETMRQRATWGDDAFALVDRARHLHEGS
jgi:transcriptional regulator with XRE-family HTH domain